MRQIVALYINDQKIDFAEPFQINMTYTMEDITDPVAVKNSYSKTIKVKGSDHNNRIFSNLWNLQTLVGSPEDFQLVRKNQFKLYLNGELMETGYCKLNEIVRTGHKVEYSITLYGGLGDFFYSLSADEDGNKKKLSDLDFGGGDDEFDLVVDAFTIQEAWNRLRDLDNMASIYDTINFAPAYNGIPADFTANKALVALKDNPWGLLPGEGYSGPDGYFLAELDKEYDEWQMRDLRSSLQRPVIRMKSIIKACCNPINNGGYTVELDPDFFNERNPYWDKTWMTLSLIPDLSKQGFSGGKTTIGLTRTYLEANGTIKAPLPIPAIESSSKASIKLVYQLRPNFFHTDVYDLYTSYSHTYELEGSGIEAEDYYYSTFYVQLLCKDASGKYVYASNIQALQTSSRFSPDEMGFVPVVDAPININEGHFWQPSQRAEYLWNGGNLEIELNDMNMEPGMTFELAVSHRYKTNLPGHDFSSITLFDPRAEGEPFYGNIITTSMDVRSTDGSYYTEVPVKAAGTITKKILLNSEASPLDYLLSYTKQFGLYFLKDPLKKHIRIMSRNSFYKGQETIDLTELIDRSKDIRIKPLAFDKKWYEFRLDAEKSKFIEKYRNSNDQDYGVMRVNTNYDFDKSSKNLLEKNAYKNAAMLRRDDPYNFDYRNRNNISVSPAFMGGAEVKYFDADGAAQDKAPIPALPPLTRYPLYEETEDGALYDNAVRLNLFDKNGNGIKGANILVFFDNFTPVKERNGKGDKYYLKLTDNNPSMRVMNDGKPCWLIGEGLDVYELPQFSRYLTLSTKNIYYSLNPGNPVETYTYDLGFNSNSSIYDRFWKRYIGDQYGQNTRVMECYVRLERKVMQDFLRKTFYFDGCLWALIEVVDYDICSYEPTRCRFIKIGKPSNYTNGQSI